MADETKIIRIVVDASRAVEGSRAAADALARIEKAQAGAGDSLSRMEASLGRVGGLLKAQVALALAEVGARLVLMAKDAFNAAAGMGELADQLGVTTQGLQALQFSAVQNGLKLEQLETGIAKFSQKIGEAADGSKEMIEALNKMGVKILDAKGNLLPTEQLLGTVAARIMALDDPAKRVAASVELFGKSGARMLPMLAELADGMDKMKAAAQDAGAMIDGSVISAFDRIADRSEVTRLKVRAMFAEFGAPIITTTLNEFNKILESTRREIEAIQKAWNWLTGGPSADSLRSSISDTEKGLADARARGMSPDDARVQVLQRRWDYLQGRLGDKLTGEYTPTLPAVTVTADGVATPP